MIIKSRFTTSVLATLILAACGTESSKTASEGSQLALRDPVPVGPETMMPSSTVGSTTLMTTSHGRPGYPAGIIGASTNWFAEYYNNYQMPAIHTTLNDSAINLDENFGLGSPQVQWGYVQPDYFSARYTSQIYVQQSGTLNFRGNSDDGMRLYIYRLDGVQFGQIDPNAYNYRNKQLLWEHWYQKPADPAQPYYASHYVTPGIYGLTVEYYEQDGAASVQMSINDNAIVPPPPPPPPPATNCNADRQWEAKYYRGDYHSGAGIGGQYPEVIGARAYAKRCFENKYHRGALVKLEENNIDAGVNPSDDFTAYFMKRVYINNTREYKYSLHADDKVKAYLQRDGENQWLLSETVIGNTKTGNLTMHPGWYTVILKVKENYGTAGVQFVIEEKGNNGGGNNGGGNNGGLPSCGGNQGSWDARFYRNDPWVTFLGSSTAWDNSDQPPYDHFDWRDNVSYSTNIPNNPTKLSLTFNQGSSVIPYLSGDYYSATFTTTFAARGKYKLNHLRLEGNAKAAIRIYQAGGGVLREKVIEENLNRNSQYDFSWSKSFEKQGQRLDEIDLNGCYIVSVRFVDYAPNKDDKNHDNLLIEIQRK